MSEEMNYSIFCMEEYKQYKHMKGEEVAEIFKKYNVFDYVISCYDALHTTGTEYMIEDIDMYIRF